MVVVVVGLAYEFEPVAVAAADDGKPAIAAVFVAAAAAQMPQTPLASPTAGNKLLHD